LSIVGQGPEEEDLRRLAQGRDVRFLGRLTDDELRGVFETHTFILVPGVEDFGYAVIEANYSGRPVVAIAAGGTLETVNDGKNGLLVSGTAVDAWADTIKELLGREWDPSALRATTEPFSEATFETSIARWLGAMTEPATPRSATGDASTEH
jgi:glycosyltransferase involved in cell wall biosynthesis